MEVKLVKLLCFCALWSATAEASPVGMTLSEYLATFNDSTLESGPSTKVIHGKCADENDKLYLPVGTILATVFDPASGSYVIHGYCGGSILNDRTVLTAGHCTEAFKNLGSLYTLLLHYGTRGRIVGQGRIVELNTPTTNSRYAQDPAADTGILRVSGSPLVLDGTSAAAIVVPPLLDSVECRKVCDCYYFYLGGRGQTSDFGDNTIPQCIMEAKISKIPKLFCVLIYGESVEALTCAGLPVIGPNSCYGDSGSTIFSPKGEACGSVSAGLSLGCSLGFGLYVDFCHPPNAAFISDYINNASP